MICVGTVRYYVNFQDLLNLGLLSVETSLFSFSVLELECVGYLTSPIMFADSLSFTSALSVALAVVFLVITVGITVIKLIDGSIGMPRLLPDVTDVSSFFKCFTVVPVLVTAYICHYNGMEPVYLSSSIYLMFFLKGNLFDV